MVVRLEPGSAVRTGGCDRSTLARKSCRFPPWWPALSDIPAETPRIARAYCPACEPDADTLLEILEVQWCAIHMPLREGLDDARRPPRLDQRPGVAQAALVHREVPRAQQSPRAPLERALLVGVEQFGERGRQARGEQAAEVLQQRGGDRLLAEVPDHGAQLRLGMKREAVIDRVDPVLRHVET